MKQTCVIHTDTPLRQRGEDAPALPTFREWFLVGRRHPCWAGGHPDTKGGTVLFEALLAIVILILSVFAFVFLFTSNTGRLAKARDNRDTAILADNILTSLRAQSDEEARRTNWLGFWTDFNNTNNPGSGTNTLYRHSIGYSISVSLTNHTTGQTNCAAVLVRTWTGTNWANSVNMYAEFWDAGAL